MKQIWLGAVSTAVLLSGCAPVMYSAQPAPVVSLNSGSNNAAGQPVGSIHANNAPVTRVAPYPAAQQQPAPAPVPAQAAPVRPQMQQPASQAGNIQVAAASPYGRPAVSEPYRGSSDDGWNVAAGSQGSSQGSSKAETPAATRSEESSSKQQAASNEPVRPKERAEAQAASSSEQSSSQASEETQVASVAPVNKPSNDSNSGGNASPVGTLLKKASASLGKGDLDGAAAYLENAHRIDPKNAKILYDIANIRYHQGRFKDAENFAGRATNAGGSNSMMKKAWALIANARKSLGDNQGAIAAAEKAASL